MKNQNNQNRLPDCCVQRGKAGKAQNKKDRGYLSGIAYGLLPHAGCIAFIVLTVIGATTAAAIFRPLLMKSYFFYGLIALSMVFATISAGIYLRKNDALSSDGIRSSWKYLSIMYGTTIAVNLLFFMVIFPLAANMVSAQAQPTPSGPATIALKVAIPCPGHASLITGELYTIQGVQSVKFRLPNLFDVMYDPSKTSKEDILSLSIFKEYSAVSV